jgi:hypothetical protein
MATLDLHMLDAGIQEIVLLLRQAGYKTFTSCEGGRGHAFREPTVGLNFKGDYFAFRDRLVEFLHAHGRRFFEVVLVSSYPKGKHYVYLQGFDIASTETRKKMERTMKQQRRRLIERLERKGLLKPGVMGSVGSHGANATQWTAVNLSSPS